MKIPLLLQASAAFLIALAGGLTVRHLAIPLQYKTAQQASERTSVETGNPAHKVEQVNETKKPQKDPAALFRDYHRRGSPLAKIALAAWAESNPEAALHWVASLEHSDDRESLLRIVLDTMAESDPEALIEDIERLDKLGPAVGTMAFECAFRAFALRDPTMAFRRANEMKVRVEIYEAIFEIWAREDRATLEIAAAEMRDRDVWQAALSQVAEARYRNDPQSARRWLENFPHRDAVDAFSIESRWNRADPEGSAMRLRELMVQEQAGEALQGGDLSRRKRELLHAGHTAMTEDEVIRILARFDASRYLVEEILPDYPPAKRARMLIASGVYDQYPATDVVFETAADLAKLSFDDAMAWAVQMRDDDMDTRANAVGRIFDVLISRDPLRALDEMSRLTDNDARDLIGSNSGLPTFDHLSPLEFAEVAETFESDYLKTWLKHHSLPWRIAGDSVADALTWVENLPVEERHPEQGAAMVYSMIYETVHDYTVVLDWAHASLPEGTFATGIYDTIAYSWEQHDRPAAAQWLANLEEGASRDAAIRGFIRSNQTEEYPEAYDLAMSMSDPEKRQESVDKVFVEWASQDPHAAAVAFPNAELSEATRAQVEQRFAQVFGN